MIIERNFVRASDGHEIYYVLYKPESPMRHIHLMHGMAEHIGRYDEFARFLVARGFSVSGHDHRGHGRTAQRNGKTGYFAPVDGFSRVVEDARQVTEHIRKAVGELPFTLFGHSMGSFVARRLIQLDSVHLSSVILSGTGGDPGPLRLAGLALARGSAKWMGKEAVNPALTKLTFGQFNAKFRHEGSEFSWLTTDRGAVGAYEEDPLCGFAMTNQFYVDLFEGLGVINRKDEINRIRKDLPVTLISGNDDPVGDSGKGVFLTAGQYRDAGIQNLAVQLVEGKRHELLHETNKEQQYELFHKWMVQYG